MGGLVASLYTGSSLPGSFLGMRRFSQLAAGAPPEPHARSEVHFLAVRVRVALPRFVGRCDGVPNSADILRGRRHVQSRRSAMYRSNRRA